MSFVRIVCVCVCVCVCVRACVRACVRVCVHACVLARVLSGVHRVHIYNVCAHQYTQQLCCSKSVVSDIQYL